MRLSRIVLGGIALSALVGCTGPLETLRQTRPGAGDGFSQALADGYFAFADSEAQQYDWIDSRHFAQKGLAASKGEAVVPEEPQEWDADAIPSQDPAAARARLMAALDAGGRTRNPNTAARAQVNYDCWLEQLEEGWQTDHIAACHDRFEKALAALEGGRPAAMPVAAPAPAANTDRYQVYFDFASAELTPVALDIVEEVANAAVTAKATKVVILGHADRSGSAETNLALSAKRAGAVKRALVRFGLGAERVDTLGLGEAEPLVATPDGAREPQNRRAVIRFE